ncbi:hypothetical protein HanRHA438_Chr03g0123281 [Helianthus annuus]|nr:hypothetical protein HanIR_Chr03g0121591 [Helianthus annuus]KAJ0935770.1 hypothetical protein HanRHA438_Chr03g0123281 [Helianthus annuus]
MKLFLTPSGVISILLLGSILHSAKMGLLATTHKKVTQQFIIENLNTYDENQHENEKNQV